MSRRTRKPKPTKNTYIERNLTILSVILSNARPDATLSAMISLAVFRKTIWKHYRLAGRDLPWRRTRDPYRILVSEIMLQQTQVERVKTFYEKFIKRFPNFAALAKAKKSDVLGAWQGLGYNRRALAFTKSAGSS